MSKSFAALRAEREESSTAWTVRDCLVEALRVIDEDGEGFDSCLLLFVRDDAGENRLERWRANLKRSEEAHVLMAADAMFKRDMLENG